MRRGRQLSAAHFHKTLWLWLLTGLLWTSMLIGETGMAGNARAYAIDVRPGPLREAIDQLATSLRLEVLYDPALVKGRVTRGVKGSMTLAQALEYLLAATDVSYELITGNTVALYRKENASAEKPPTQAQPATDLEVIHVNAQRSAADSGRRADLMVSQRGVPGLATPINIQTVSRDLLVDQQPERIEDALEGVSGIEVAPDGQDTVGFIIRGIPVYQYYVDGVRVSPDLHHDAFRELADVESIDVVKGPASALYGRTEPGGAINVVTKQPLETPYLSVQQQIGAFSRHRTLLDAGGPLENSGRWLYRFNAAWESADSYREDLSNRRLFLAPVVRWNVSPQSEVTTYMEYLRSDDPTDSGVPVVGSRVPDVSVDRRIEDGGEVHTRDIRTGVRGWHVLNAGWSLRYHLDGRQLHTPQSPQLALAENGLDPDLCTRSACPVERVLFSIPVSRGQTSFGSAELLGDLGLWGTRHAVLLGGEFFGVHGLSVVRYSARPFVTDLFRPNHEPVPGYLLAHPYRGHGTRTSERWSSVYLQDQVAIDQRVYLMLGVRYDHAREWANIKTGVPLQDSGTGVLWDHAFKRHAGIVWRATGPLSLYANYAENFGISTGIYGNGTGGTGTLVPPETAREWEVGTKGALFDSRVSASAAWFDLTEFNISLPGFVGVHNAEGFRTVTGAERTRGVELDVRGAVSANLELAASYAYLDTRILDDSGIATGAGGNMVMTPGNTGHRLFGVPRNGGSAWVTYRSWGSWQGLKVGVGMVARSWRDGDNQNDYALPGFLKCSVLAGYEWPWGDGRLAVQLNLDNAFNTRYFESIGGTHSAMPGAPRRWLATIGWTGDSSRARPPEDRARFIRDQAW
jgi:iron complex outermembrane recepter protein